MMAVLISHRFSTVRMADRILVLKDGELADDGSHEELVARGGLLRGCCSSPASRGIPVTTAPA